MASKHANESDLGVEFLVSKGMGILMILGFWNLVVLTMFVPKGIGFDSFKEKAGIVQ